MAGSSDKSRGVALILALLLGWAGGHRFYVGKTGTGILMLCTLGGLGLWYLYDLILIAGGGFRDADGRRVLRWDPDTTLDDDTTQAMLDELDALRHEVAELANRVDFTERLMLKEGRPGEEVR